MEWIRVKDRLPYKKRHEQCDVIIYGNNDGIRFMRSAFFEDNTFKTSKGIREDYALDMRIISHWMYFPEPPNMEEERLKQEIYERESSGYTQKD